MKTSERAMPLLLEFVGVAGMSMVMYASLLRSGQVFGAIGVGAVFAAIIAISRPNYVPQLNPIITFGLWLTQRLSHKRAAVTVLMQMLGGLAAWQVSEFLLDRPLSSLAGDKFNVEIFVAEMIGAFIFTFLLSHVLYSRRIETGTFALVGFTSIAVAMLVASLPQGAFGIVNPALALGIQSWSWTFVAGPFAGAFIGMNIIPLFNFIDSRSANTKKPAKKRVTKKK